MKTEDGSVLTVTFYISKNSFVNQCCKEKPYLASNNVILFFLFFCSCFFLFFIATL